MDPNPHRTAARQLAASHVAAGDPLGWFDALYRRANGQTHQVPWADLRPNKHFVQWLSAAPLPPARALVIGCGLGDDAEFLSSLGWSVDAFDISPKAIAWAQNRFPDSRVNYHAVDLFKSPPDWRRAFDLVVEIYTLQVLTPPLREKAVPLISDWVAPNGRLFLFARAREESDDPGSMPWPLTTPQARAFEKAGLDCLTFHDYLDDEQPPVRRFRAVFTRPHK